MRFKKETYSLHTQYVLYMIPYNPTMGPMGVMTPAARTASNPPKANTPQAPSEGRKIWGKRVNSTASNTVGLLCSGGYQ